MLGLHEAMQTYRPVSRTDKNTIFITYLYRVSAKHFLGKQYFNSRLKTVFRVYSSEFHLIIDKLMVAYSFP